MKHPAVLKRNSALNLLVYAVSVAAIGAIVPAHAEDKNQRDALLEAALQRISALEAKVGRINSLEDENRQLRSKLVKVENKQDAALKVSSKSLANAKVAALSNDRPYVTATASDISNSKTTLWEGAYAGINAGYGTGNLQNYTNTSVLDKQTNTLESITNSSKTSYLAGAVAGGQFGYNHVFANHIMLGAEADINWADIYNTATPNNTSSLSVETTARKFPNDPVEMGTSYATGYGRVGMDWVGTVRGRLGYDLGKFLPYVTGGLAYGEISSSNHSTETSVEYVARGAFPFPPVSTFEPTGGYTRGSSASVSAGWAAGAGAEYMVADGWSVKGEYLYTSIGGVTTPQFSQQTEQSDTKSFTTNNTGSFGVHQARIGLNYHPGWSFTEPVLAAKE